VNRLFICILLGITPTISWSQEAYLVKDINASPSPDPYSNPEELVALGGRLFFAASTLQNGEELWISDGSEAGTRMVKDIRPGGLGSNPAELTPVGDTVFFVADDGVHGRHLWMSDGTGPGTVMFSDITLFRVPNSLVEHAGELYCAASTDIVPHDYRILWRTDGTVEGTSFIDPEPPVTSPGLGVTDITSAGDKLFFVTGNDSSRPDWLFVTEGTAGSTSALIETGTISYLTSVDDRVFFTVFDTVAWTRYLYVSNGISSGTRRVPSDSTAFANLTDSEGTLFFTASNAEAGTELWKVNAPATATLMVKDIRPGSSSSYPGALADVGGTLFFEADDGVHGSALWKSDGTEAGTLMVSDSPDTPSNITDVNGTAFFTLSGWDGHELWKRDGTEAGTVFLTDTCPIPRTWELWYLTNVNGTLFFNGFDGAHGRELWKSDGTGTGTVMVKDIWPSTQSSSPEEMLAIDGALFLRAWSGERDDNYDRPYYQLWRSDGTDAGTELLRQWDPSNSVIRGLTQLTDMKGTLYFSVLDIHDVGRELWKSDGTPEGTALVKDIRSGPYGSIGEYGAYFTPLDSTLLFAADDGIHGKELWKSDGTEAGTMMVLDIYPGGSALSSTPAELTVVGDNVFFSATGGPTQNRELWKSDGTPAGTVMVSDIRLGTEGSVLRDFLRFRDALFFTADDGTNGRELWRSDGTDEGTMMVKDIRPNDSQSSTPSRLTDVRGTLFFRAYDSEHGAELWKTDGTEAGTVMVKDIVSGSSSSNPEDLIEANGRLFFSINNRQLWTSDGTEAGTTMLMEVLGLNTLWNVGGMLVFVGEGAPPVLWISDGTPQGTAPFASVRPYTTKIEDLTPSCGRVFFSASDQLNGEELWALEFEDDDCDNVFQSIDNCPYTPNQDQLDCDGDDIGEACDVIYLGDLDGNGVSGLEDLRALVDCLGGPAAPPAPAIYGCADSCAQAFDYGGDARIDLLDVAEFQSSFDGR